VEPAGAAVRVKQEYSGGRMAVLEVDTPAVIGVQAAPQPPRYVPISRLRQVMAGGPPELVEGAAGALPARTTVLELAAPEKGAGAEMLSGSPDDVAERILAVLGERGLVRR
jgi:electron transfer flavoprotein beta subunit